ncbi:hypothetical protein [Shewanella algae]|uniref:hypothetical protein n=1 Tax=Shewanella algae TaxID=38313 RepID=UPI00399B8E05
MILNKTQHTNRQRTEFRLLVAIHFACLMAKAKGFSNPMDCPRVQTRTTALVDHLAYEHPSQPFEQQYFHHAGELGRQFSLRYTQPKHGIRGTVTVWDNSAANNIHQLHRNFA